MQSKSWGWIVVAVVNVMAWGVLGLQGRIGAAPPDVRLPFDNAIQQRAEIIRELQEIKAILKDQTSLLRSGQNRPDTYDRKARP